MNGGAAGKIDKSKSPINCEMSILQDKPRYNFATWQQPAADVSDEIMYNGHSSSTPPLFTNIPPAPFIHSVFCLLIKPLSLFVPCHATARLSTFRWSKQLMGGWTTEIGWDNEWEPEDEKKSAARFYCRQKVISLVGLAIWHHWMDSID